MQGFLSHLSADNWSQIIGWVISTELQSTNKCAVGSVGVTPEGICKSCQNYGILEFPDNGAIMLKNVLIMFRNAPTISA